MDSLVGLLLLAMAASLLFTAYANLTTLSLRQSEKAEALLNAADGKDYASWF